MRDGKLGDLNAQIRTYGEDRAAADCGVGVPTLRDVAAELMKPGRDIRDELPKPILRTDVLEMKDLKPGMVLTGTVRNVIDFGVFVDIGVHQDGLVHISQVSQQVYQTPLGGGVCGRHRPGGGAGGGREEKAHRPQHEAGAQGVRRETAMILTIDRVNDLLDDMADSFPAALFDGLNGGINLLEEAKPDPEFPEGEMYILGEYCDDLLGQYINLYYGSFAALAEREDWGQETWEDELYTTLSHELTHHMEGRGGLHALDDRDAEELEEYRREYGGEM